MADVHHRQFRFASGEAWAYAVNMVETVAWLAGQPDYLDEVREAVKELDLFNATKRPLSAKIFEWLGAATSYQGISDTVARNYMAVHGRPRWRAIAHGAKYGSCPLLQSYWHFHGCGYRKSGHTCSMPHLIDSRPLPSHEFRNGNLNQLAYSLFLFIRDVADGDLVGWIDGRLAEAEPGSNEDRLERMSAAIIKPLAGVQGVSDIRVPFRIAMVMVLAICKASDSGLSILSGSVSTRSGFRRFILRPWPISPMTWLIIAASTPCLARSRISTRC